MKEKRREEPLQGMKKVSCPYCGRPVNVFCRPDAVCRGVFLKCKGPDCLRQFELRL